MANVYGIDLGDRTPALETRNLTVSRGSTIVVNDLSMAIPANRVVGLVGPSGCGKTTLLKSLNRMNDLDPEIEVRGDVLLHGESVYQPDEGRFTLRGEDLTGMVPHQIKKKGISRTFQQSRLVLALSVYDNLFIGMLEGFKAGFFDTLVRRSRFKRELAGAVEKANALLSQFNEELVDKGFTTVSDISQIDRRRLEICRALATEPALLLLDEPSAGMTPEESFELMNDIRRVRQKYYRQLSIILVEHDMLVIEGITDRVVALNYGQKIAEGTFEDVASNEELREAYLGK